MPKTLAIRMDDDTHAQLTVLAQLQDIPVSDALKQAVDDYIQSRRGQSQFAEQAESALANIEREAATRRDAITSLFGENKAASGSGKSADDAEPTSTRRGRDKGGAPATS